MTTDRGAADCAAWRSVIQQYCRSSTPRALWQLANTLIPYAVIWYLIHLSLAVSWWLVVPLAVLAGGFLVRTFIIFHDCGHGSFFGSRRANDVVGFVTGVLTFTPYYHWRWEHAIHHGSAGRLDKRGTGDVWTMTVREYLEASRARRFAYRLSRNPVVLFVAAPLLQFLVLQRVPSRRAAARERHSVWWTNLALLGMAIGLSSIFGFVDYAIVQTIIVGVAGAAGIWLFYVQHQFEEVYWEHGEEWSYVDAALRGSSFYRLPKALQWFSGNIGFHHVHHLSARIPNYHLQRCHESEPMFREVRPLTLLASLKTLRLRLWDEQRRKLIGFHQLRRPSRGLSPG
ncbi:fatty acid desaturase [Solimonas marina]|uniref:Fatty acid desaturase n=1 Tax=Solimonas marina TaxID=2714601 RepID=A0A969W821_9GAMM|nr:fatty acid desaturase [Solimonas marina]NKF22122.1 fatty acid desaturase [Solimonas marina]